MSLVAYCENPDYCDGTIQGNAILNSRELASPIKCVFCRRALCDACGAELTMIPHEAFPRLGPSKRPDGRYSGWACSEHFKEEWA